MTDVFWVELCDEVKARPEGSRAGNAVRLLDYEKLEKQIAELEAENVHHKNNIEQLLNEKKTDRADAIREMLDEVLKTFDSYDASDLMAEIWDYADNLEGESDG